MFFEEDFPLACNSEDIDRIKSAYPDLDETYVVTGSIKDRKELIGDLWCDFEPYADRDFANRSKIKGAFNKSMWELYLGATLVRRGFALVPRKRRGGPDFQLKADDDRSIWIEATTPSRGEVDPVPARPEIRSGEACTEGGNIEVLNRPKILRITHAVKEKHSHYQRSLEAGIIGENDPYLVAVNGFDFSGIADLPDYLFRWALFAAGPLSYPIGSDGKLGEPSLAYRPMVHKQRPGGQEIEQIECGLFCGNVYEDISAVIFSMEHVIHCPRDRDKAGSNLIFARNPFARNPIPDGFWQIGREWSLKDQKLACINYDCDQSNFY